MLSTIKNTLLKAVGTDFVLNHLAQLVAKILQSVGSNYGADKLLYDFGKKIRETLPGTQVEDYLGELLAAFKLGLLGKEYDQAEVEESAEEEGN